MVGQAISLTSPSSQRSYDHVIREFINWYCSVPRLVFNRIAVTRYRISLEQAHYASSTINVRLAAVRRPATQPGSRRRHPPRERREEAGRSPGERVDRATGKAAARVFDRESLRGKRDYAMVAVLLDCGLRRAELAALDCHCLQQREEHWVFADLMGRGAHVRTVPVPTWVVTLQIIWRKSLRAIWRTEPSRAGQGIAEMGVKCPLPKPVAIAERNAIQFRNAQIPASRATVVSLQNRNAA